ncbi:hypothetical protein [Streptomyces sp. SCSIO ZS0520]|uniref:hypothetical protein n=1 Tax=Streptomyces sp. SCSIO ZS0520 TaxID=2892996 RepID=UPI0021D9864C|nr:hypothetical protein [Streptomyces sp. SCSIO ZS0520]
MSSDTTRLAPPATPVARLHAAADADYAAAAGQRARQDHRVPGLGIPAVPAPVAEQSGPYRPLFDPATDAVDWAPPVDTALTLARMALEQRAAANIHDHTAMVVAATALDGALRRLVAALDAEEGR